MFSQGFSRLRTDEAAASGYFEDGIHEDEVDLAFTDVSERTGGDRATHVLSVLVYGICQGRQRLFMETRDQGYAVLVAQGEINQCHIRMVPFDTRQGIGAIGSFRAYGNALGLQQASQALAHRWVIIYDQDANGFRYFLYISFQMVRCSGIVRLRIILPRRWGRHYGRPQLLKRP